VKEKSQYLMWMRTPIQAMTKLANAASMPCKATKHVWSTLPGLELLKHKNILNQARGGSNNGVLIKSPRGKLGLPTCTTLDLKLKHVWQNADPELVRLSVKLLWRDHCKELRQPTVFLSCQEMTVF
jgi:hypothetical protein